MSMSAASGLMDSPLPREGRPWARLAEWQLALPLGLAFAALFLAPLLLLVGVSFFDDDKITQPGFGSWIKFFGDPFNYKVIGDTLLLGVKTVCATVVVGYPLALVYLDLSARLQRGLLFIIVMPLLLLPLISVMSRLDPNLRDASAALGASRWRTLFTVIVPLSMPGLVAGCLLVFASSTTAFISQTVIGGVRLIYLPLLIWQQSLVVYNWPLAAVASLSLVVSVLSVIAALSCLGRRSSGHLHG